MVSKKMETTAKSDLFVFSSEEVLLLLQYRIELNPRFVGRRSEAIDAWETVAERLNNGCNGQQVAQKFSNIINLYNKYKAMLSKTPDMQITWPYFHVVKEAIKMLMSLNKDGFRIDFENYDSSLNDQMSDEDYEENDNDSNKENGIEDYDDGDNDTSNVNQPQRSWKRETVMKLIHLRGEKYAQYFNSKDKTVNNKGWAKIRVDEDFWEISEKQLRKKWQNMVHRYKCIHESVRKNEQTVCWQFYEPIAKVLSKRQTKYTPRVHTRRSIESTTAQSEKETVTSTASPSVSNTGDGVPEPEVIIALSRELITRSSQRIKRHTHVKGMYANMQKGVDESEDEMSVSRNGVQEQDSNECSHKSWTSVFAYERERDKVLFAQNNNMLKMMKALLEKQGIRIPYDVTVNYSHI